MLILAGGFRSFRLRGGFPLSHTPDSDESLELAEPAVVSSRAISFSLPSDSDGSGEVAEAAG